MPRYTTDELLRLLRDFAADSDGTPSAHSVDDADSLPASQTYQNRFGSWNAAVQAANLDPNTPQDQRLPEDELLTHLREFADELGHTPSYREMDQAADRPSATTYRRRFGSWNAAVEAVGLHPNSSRAATVDRILCDLSL